MTRSPPRARRSSGERFRDVHFTRESRGVSACFEFIDETSCKWHVTCCSEPSDTGTGSTAGGSQASSQGQGLRGGRRSEHGRTMRRSAPPPAHRLARVPRVRMWNRFFRVTWSPGGSYPVPSCVGSRERGESNSSRRTQQCGCSTSSQFVTKNQIRPVNEAGRAVGFIPVTPCSLGKRQPEGGAIHRFGCLFDLRGSLLTLRSGAT